MTPTLPHLAQGAQPLQEKRLPIEQQLLAIDSQVPDAATEASHIQQSLIVVRQRCLPMMQPSMNIMTECSMLSSSTRYPLETARA